jgi:hypothetical protein
MSIKKLLWAYALKFCAGTKIKKGLNLSRNPQKSKFKKIV